MAAVAIRVTPQIQVSLLAACTAHCSLYPPRKTAGGFDVVRYRRVRGAAWLCFVFAATRTPAPPTRLPLQRELSAQPTEGAEWKPPPGRLPPPHRLAPPLSLPLQRGCPPPQGSLFRGSCRRSRLRVPPADPSRQEPFHSEKKPGSYLKRSLLFGYNYQRSTLPTRKKRPAHTGGSLSISKEPDLNYLVQGFTLEEYSSCWVF